MRAHALISFALVLASAPVLRAQSKVDRLGDALPEGAIARLGTTRLSHDGHAIAFAGARMIVSAAGHDVMVWDARTGALVRAWDVSPWGEVSRIVASADGKGVAVAAGHTILVGEPATATRLRQVFVVERSDVPPPGWLGFTRDGSALALITRRGAIWVADLDQESPPRHLAYSNPHPLAGFSPDGKTLTVWHQNQVDRFDAAKLEKIATVKFPFLGAFKRLRLRTDGSLFAMHLDRGVVFWDPLAEKEAGRIENATFGVEDEMDFSPDGRLFVTVTRGSTALVRVWDVATRKPAWSFTITNSEAGEPVVSPDGKAIVFATAQRFITPRDLRTGKPLFARGGLDTSAVGLSFLPGGKLVAAGGRQLCVWTAATGEPVRKIELPFEPVTGLAVDPGGKFAVVSGPGVTPRRCDLTTGQVEGEFALPAATLVNTNGLALSGDGRTLCALMSTGPKSRPVRLNWDTATRLAGPRWDLENESQETSSGRYSSHSFMTGPYRVEFTPGQRPPPETGLPSDITRRLQVHALVDDLLLMRVVPAGMPQRAAAGGPILAVVSWAPNVDIGGEVSDDSAIEVWEVASGERLLQVRAGNGKRWGDNAQWTIAAAPDGRTVAVARGAAIVLRDVASGAELLKRTADAAVLHVKFAPDGRSLASAHSDGTLLTWDVAAVTRRGAARAVTTDEAEACWRDLGRDGKAARKAIELLVGDPGRALDLLRGRLTPAPPVDTARVAQLIADLDSSKFRARQAASRELASAGARVAPMLQQARNSAPSVEMQSRLEKLLSEPFSARTPEALRAMRAIDLLERLATTEARAILTDLSRGDAAARETLAAQAALQRLRE